MYAYLHLERIAPARFVIFAVLRKEDFPMDQTFFSERQVSVSTTTSFDIRMDVHTLKDGMRKAPPEVSVQTDAMIWLGEAVRSASKGIDIREYIASKSGNPEFVEGLADGRIRLANEMYSDERCIRQLRLSKGLSQDDLAQKAGVLKLYIERVESGRYQPNLQTVKKLALALDIEYLELCKIMEPDV